MLKNEVRKAEKVRHNVYDIVSAERRREQSRRARDMERYAHGATGLVCQFRRSDFGTSADKDNAYTVHL